MAYKAKDAVKRVLKKDNSQVNNIIAYESGELSEQESIKMFQKLVNSGQAWRLQGSYGRTAQNLLDAGLIKPPKNKTMKNSTDYYGNQIY